MLPDNLTAAFLFSVVMAFTPGPNNVMLAASGANFGHKQSIPQKIGRKAVTGPQPYFEAFMSAISFTSASVTGSG
jgi:threonine/homoserine/homoserine lactone efflux protein